MEKGEAGAATPWHELKKGWGRERSSDVFRGHGSRCRAGELRCGADAQIPGNPAMSLPQPPGQLLPSLRELHD